MAGRKLPLPDGPNVPLRSRPIPPPPSDDPGPPPPLPSRRVPPPPPAEPKHSESVESDDSEASFDSDESYEKMHNKTPPIIPQRNYRQERDLSPTPPQSRSFAPALPNRRGSSPPPLPTDRKLPPPPSESPPFGRKQTALPPLPTGRAKPSYPAPVLETEPQDIYDDGDVGDVYEATEEEEAGELYTDADAGDVYDAAEVSPSPSPPPPLPPQPRSKGLPTPPSPYEVQEMPPQPQSKGLPTPPSPYEVKEMPPEPRKAAPLPAPPQDTYEIEEEEPSRANSRRLPPLPPPDEEAVYEVEPTPHGAETEPIQDIYDSVLDEQEPKPESKSKRGALPPPPASRSVDSDDQEEYDEFDVVDDNEPPQETYDAFEVGDEIQETYEPVPDSPIPPPPPPSRGAPSAPSPPPPPGKGTKRPPLPTQPKKDPPALKTSGSGIDLSAVLGARKNLRSVGKPPIEKEPSVESEKVYGETDVQSAFQKFRQKEKEAGQKPPVMQKPGTFAKPSNLPIGPKPVPSPGVRSPLTSKSTETTQGKKAESPYDTCKDIPPRNKRTKTPSPPPVPVSDRPVPQSYSKVSPKVHNGTTHVQVAPEDDDDQDIYDDAMSQHVDPMMKEPWFFKDLDRKDGERRLKNMGDNGSFLIRESSKGAKNQPYTMMVLYSNLIYNLKIRERDDGRVALGEEKPDEMAFDCVKDMVTYHRSNDVILVHNGKQNLTLLKQSPSK